MDDLIAKLRARRDRLAADLERVDTMLAEHERVAAMISNFVAELPMDVPEAPIEVRRHPTQVIDAGRVAAERGKRGPKGSSPEEIATAADLIIRERGQPMTRFELIEPIEAMGLKIGGVDKPRNLGTILWRSQKFSSTGDGYWPKDTKPSRGMLDDDNSLGGDDDLGVASAGQARSPA